MDVRIITFHDAKNYGASLQAYALAYFLNHNKVDAQIIDLAEEKGKIVGYRQRISEFLNKALYFFHKKELDMLHDRFSTFMYRNMPLTAHYSDPGELLSNPPKADLYICGSDQIWNCSTGLRECYFLNFGSSKKISYAASIGVDFIPEEYQKRVGELLASFDAISVREENAKTLLASLFDLEVEVSMDPTFLLTKNEWEQLVDTPIINGKYILYYPLHRSKLAIEYLNELKQMLGAKVVTITTSPLPVYGDVVIRSAGPVEFLNLYRYATYTINASFHGTVFSLIFEKPFNTQIYGQSGGRVINLLERCGLKNRIFTDEKRPDDTSSKIDYGHVRAMLQKDIEGSKRYLEKHINT